MLVRSSPVECTPLTLPPWYQSHTIATAFPATKSAAGEPRRASLPCATPANGGAASDARVVSTGRVLPRRMKGLLETLPRTRVLSAFSAHPQVRARSVRAALGHDGRDRLHEDRDVEPERPVLKVVEVESDEVV